MTGLTPTSTKTYIRYVRKGSCDGGCSLNNCKKSLLSGTYNDIIKEFIKEADVDANMFDVKRSLSAESSFLNAASDCASYNKKMFNCLCFTHGDQANFRRFDCPYYEKKGLFASMSWHELPSQTAKCEEHSCNRELDLKGDDRILTCGAFD